MSSVNLKVEEFHRRHGGECYSDGGKWYYPNGAYRDVNKMGILADPWPATTPDNIHRNAENVVAFHRVKLGHLAAKFDELDFRLSSTVPNDPKAALAELKSLRSAIQKAKRELKAAEEAADATEIGRRRKQLQGWREEALQQFHEFQKQRRSIRV